MRLLITDGVPSSKFVQCVRLSLLRPGTQALEAAVRAPGQYDGPYSPQNELETLEWLARVVEAAVQAVERAEGPAKFAHLEQEMEHNPSPVARQMYQLRLMYHKNLQDAAQYLRGEQRRVDDVRLASVSHPDNNEVGASEVRLSSQQGKWEL